MTCCINCIWQSSQEGFGEHLWAAPRVRWVPVALMECMAIWACVQADTGKEEGAGRSWHD